MYGFFVLLHGMTASFREPGSHLYQATLPLPPISALVGMAGAALGKSFEKAWPFFKDAGLFVGVSGRAGGNGIDLWNYDKMAVPKGSEESAHAKLYGLSKVVRKDILNREFLADPEFVVFYALRDQEKAACLHSAFKDPVYALSLGSSDDIALVRDVSALCAIGDGEESDSFADTLLPGDHADDVRFDWDALKRACVVQTLKAPMVRPLIVDFEFKGDERHGSRYRLFTFLSGHQRIQNPQRAFRFPNVESPVPLYGLEDEEQ